MRGCVTLKRTMTWDVMAGYEDMLCEGMLGEDQGLYLTADGQGYFLSIGRQAAHHP